ncbi:MAG: hypothetical protein Kow0075_15240 [Salibacteraceae bacterium]
MDRWFYSERSPLSAKGVFVCILDPASGEVNSKKYNTFSDEFFRQLDTGNGKGEVEANYSFDDLILTGSGAYVIGEWRYTITLRDPYDVSPGITVKVNLADDKDYLFKNMVVVKLGPKGQFVWDSRITKWQIASNGTRYSGYSFLEKDGKVYLLYIDNPKNTSPKETLKRINSSAPSKGIIRVVEISKDGKPTIVADHPIKGMDVWPQVGRPILTEGNSIYILADKKMNNRFLRMVIGN